MPALGAFLITKVLERLLLPPIPKWWPLGLTGVYAVISLVVMVVAYRSGYHSVFEKEYANLTAEYERAGAAYETWVMTLMPLIIVSFPGAFFPPSVAKPVRLALGFFVSAVLQFLAAYILTKEGWSEPSFVVNPNIVAVDVFIVSVAALMLILTADFGDVHFRYSFASHTRRRDAEWPFRFSTSCFLLGGVFRGRACRRPLIPWPYTLPSFLRSCSFGISSNGGGKSVCTCWAALPGTSRRLEVLLPSKRWERL